MGNHVVKLNITTDTARAGYMSFQEGHRMVFEVAKETLAISVLIYKNIIPTYWQSTNTWEFTISLLF